MAQHSQERSSTGVNTKKLWLHHFSPAAHSAGGSSRVAKRCPSHTLLTLRVSGVLQLEKTSSIPGERDDPPIEFAPGVCHSGFIRTGTPPGTDKATEHYSFAAAYLMVSL